MNCRDPSALENGPQDDNARGDFLKLKDLAALRLKIMNWLFRAEKAPHSEKSA
jgi:hypothetical protein